MRVVYKHVVTEELRRHIREASMMNRTIEKIVLTDLEAQTLAEELTQQHQAVLLKKDISGMTFYGVKLEVQK